MANMDGINNMKLRKIALAVGNNEKLFDLGLVLEFEPPQIYQFIETNKSGANVTSAGTFNMLFDWSMRTSKNDQVPTLYRALDEVGLIAIAQDHLSGDSSAARPTEPGSNERNNSSAPGTEVTPKQIDWLSRNFPNNQYENFCLNLANYEYHAAHNILEGHNKNYMKALKQVLNEWKTATGGNKADLEKALRRSEAAGLIRRVFSE